MKISVTIPFEEPQATLRHYIERAWPEGSKSEISTIISTRKATVDGRPEGHSDRRLPAGATLEFEADESEASYELPDAVDLGRGEGWVVVEKSIGTVGHADHEDPMNHVLYLADLLGVDREEFFPLWDMPVNCGGPWPIAMSKADATRLREAIMKGEVKTTWTVVAPAPSIPRGEFKYNGFVVHYGTTRKEKGLAELQLNPDFAGAKAGDPLTSLLDLLARYEIPAVGDRERGGLIAEGGLRLHLTAIYGADFGHSWNAPNWWPGQLLAPEELEQQSETSLPEARRDHGIPSLTVSRKTLEVMADGHPWALADKETGGRDSIKQGTVVQLVSPQGQPGPYALLEHGKVAARYFTRDASLARSFTEEVTYRLNRAIARRRDLLKNTETTDVFRLVHAEADGLPGLEIERMGTLLRAVITGGAANRLKGIVYENILQHDPGALIIEAPHLRDVRQEKNLPQARVVKGNAYHVIPGDRTIGREHGLKYWLEPWEGIDVGFFADQRDNRKRLLETVKQGERWLNLFCHTGAFSVVLAHCGAEVVSVDLSKRYLDWLQENLELNELDVSLNTNFAEDAREYVARSKGGYDGIIVDPPTAAQGSAGFWSVRKDYEKLLLECHALLNPGGVMLICRNDKQQKEPLRQFVEQILKGKFERIEDAPAAADYPGLTGFPEGDAFDGVWVYTST